MAVGEELHNPDFNRVQFEAVRSEAGLNRFIMTPTKWIERTNAIGIVSKAGIYQIVCGRIRKYFLKRNFRKNGIQMMRVNSERGGSGLTVISISLDIYCLTKDSSVYHFFDSTQSGNLRNYTYVHGIFTIIPIS